MKELLDTDRANYLVWKYLIECNYRETAAKLQKEWRIKAPHRQFAFAPHVRDYALVTLVNKGLLYEETERQLAESRQTSAAAEREPWGVFGPLVDEERRFADQDEDDDDEDDEDAMTAPENPAEAPENRRKRTQHELPNGNSKRQRLSSGFEVGGDPMETDHADNNHAYPSPLEGEHAASPRPRTEGPSRGTQIEKARDLTHETIFLHTGTTGAVDGTEASPALLGNESPLVLQCEWNPRDPSCLAVGGTDALARLWNVSRGAEPDQDEAGHVDGSPLPFVQLLDDDVHQKAAVTAMAWSPQGDVLALGLDLGKLQARVAILAADGTTLHRFEGLEAPVLKLRWSPNNDLLLCITPEKENALITVFSSAAAESASYFLAHDMQTAPLDGVWVGERDFVIGGGETLLRFECGGNEIVERNRFPVDQGSCLTLLQFDPQSKFLATGSDKGIIEVWCESGQHHSLQAHLGVINAMKWQPSKAEAGEEQRLLATSGEDCAIIIWNVQNTGIKSKYYMSMPLPVTGLAISPDGAFIAGATRNQILVWKMGEYSFPKASWSSAPHPGWQSPKGGPFAESEPFVCLGWDSEGKRLVYSAISRLAVINFR